jgi:hypothetical protein
MCPDYSGGMVGLIGIYAPGVRGTGSVGAEIFPVFDRCVASASFDRDGKLLLREIDALDTICRDLSLTQFSSFGDNREIPADFSGEPEDLKEVLGESDEWFEIDDGLKTIDGLVRAIAKSPETAVPLENPEEVRSDLEALADCLRAARSANVRFRLGIG